MEVQYKDGRKLNTDVFTVETICKLVKYDALTGHMHTNNKTARRLLGNPNEQDQVVIWCNESKKRKKCKLKTLAWICAHKQLVPEGYKVFCIDLDEDNVSLDNIRLVPKALYKGIELSIRNLQGALKYEQHPKDVHAFVLKWLSDRRVHREIFYDLASVQARKRELELQFTKFVSKHVRTA
jgi:hypothetical protein